MNRGVWTILGCTALLAACHVDLALPETESLRLQVYQQGSPVAECKLAPGTPNFQKLASWLSNNRTGWTSTLASYVPGVYITGSNFSINFLRTFVIVNSPEGQYSHSVSPSEYEFLQCPAANWPPDPVLIRPRAQ